MTWHIAPGQMAWHLCGIRGPMFFQRNTRLISSWGCLFPTKEHAFHMPSFDIWELTFLGTN